MLIHRQPSRGRCINTCSTVCIHVVWYVVFRKTFFLHLQCPIFVLCRHDIYRQVLPDYFQFIKLGTIVSFFYHYKAQLGWLDACGQFQPLCNGTMLVQVPRLVLYAWMT